MSVRAHSLVAVLAFGCLTLPPRVGAQEPSGPETAPDAQAAETIEAPPEPAASVPADVAPTPPPQPAAQPPASPAAASGEAVTAGGEPAASVASPGVAVDAGASAKAPPADEAAPEGDGDTPAVPPPAGLRVEALGGVGLATRRFERPVPEGLQRLESSVVVALEGGLRVTGWAGERLSLSTSLQYQTSVGLEVKEEPAFALPNEVPARTERVAVQVSPRYRLMDAPDSPDVAAVAGASISAFAPDVRDLNTPAYHLAGPHLGLRVGVQLWSGVRVTAGPDLQWIVSVGDALTGAGLESTGVGVSGEAVLAIDLAERWKLELSYREDRATLSHEGSGADFEDVQRFATGRIGGAL